MSKKPNNFGTQTSRTSAHRSNLTEIKKSIPITINDKLRALTAELYQMHGDTCRHTGAMGEFLVAAVSYFGDAEMGKMVAQSISEHVEMVTAARYA